MPSYVLYARKSTESEDRQVLSIDSQVSELRTLAARRGLAIGDVLTEAQSAKAPGRPVFGTLMRRVGRGEIRGILCWKMDRLARNHLDTGSILQALADGKIEEVVTPDRTYTRDGNDRFMGSFELGIATKFIDDLRTNVKRGIRARLGRGWPNYVPPLGYLNDRASKTVVADPERFALVRRMWDLFLTGAHRPSQIAAIANREWGFRTRTNHRGGGKPLGHKSLYEMFANPYYMGIIQLQSGDRYIGAHEPMVTRQEFDRAQELLGRPHQPRPKHHDFPFAGLIRCGSCGAAVTPEQHVKPSGRRYVYYRCAGRRADRACRERPLAESALLDQVVAFLGKIAIPERVLRWAVQHVQATLDQEMDTTSRGRAMLEASLVALRRESDNLLSLRLKDLVGDDVFAQKKRELERHREELEAKLTAPTRPAREVSELTVSALTFASKAAETFRHGTGVQRRTILESVSSNSEIQGGQWRALLKNPYRLAAETGSSPEWYRLVRDVRTWTAQTDEFFAVPILSGNMTESGRTIGNEPVATIPEVHSEP